MVIYPLLGGFTFMSTEKPDIRPDVNFYKYFFRLGNKNKYKFFLSIEISAMESDLVSRPLATSTREDKDTELIYVPCT